MLLSDSYWKNLIRIGASLLLFAGARPVHAQLIACSNPGTPEEFKVYQDDLRSTSTNTPPLLQARLESLAQSLHDNLMVALGDLASLKRCNKRFPQDVSELKSQIGSLDQIRVVLEIWGALGGADGNQGELGFLLVPAHSLTPAVPPVIVVRGDFKGVKKSIQQGTFIPVVLGTNLYQIGQFEESVGPLCEGQKKLEVALAKLPANPTPDQKSLAEHEKLLLAKVRDMVDDALKHAKASGKPQYKDLAPEADGHFSCSK